MTQKFKGTAGSNVNWGGTFAPTLTVTADANGVINSISWTLGVLNVASVDVRAGIWDDSAGLPNQLKDWSAKTNYTTTGDKTMALTQGYSLVNGTTYHIGIGYAVNNNDINMPTDTSRTTSAFYYGSGSGVTTFRDTPTLNQAFPGTPQHPSNTAMFWADQTTTVTTSDTLAKSNLTLTGELLTQGTIHVDSLLKTNLALSGKTIVQIVSNPLAKRNLALTGFTFPNGLFHRDFLVASVLKLASAWHGYSPDSDNNVTDNEARRRGFKTGLSLWGASHASGGDTNTRTNRKWYANLLFGKTPAT